MKTVGIIAEYNPFHKGHEYQLEYVRKNLGADFIIIAMSGDFVQRGMPALLPKHIRAEMALRCGGDLVLELPVSFSTASAEFFARGGVELLNGLGVVHELCFGSEAGGSKILMETAKVLNNEPPVFRETLRKKLSDGLSYPAARQLALLSCADTEGFSFPKNDLAEALSSPNNILGIEYCKAILRLKSPIKPVSLKREGSGYHDTRLFAGRFPSASAIRKALFSGNADELQNNPGNMIPAPAAELFSKAADTKAFFPPETLDSLFLYRLLMETPDSLCRYMDMTPELAQRIFRLRGEFRNFSRFAELLKTKNITQTRIQRALLHMLLGIVSLPEKQDYARVLGFRKSAAPLLGEIKKRGSIPLLTKPADAGTLLGPSALSLLEETTFASNLYQGLLSQRTGQPFVHEYSKPIVIL